MAIMAHANNESDIALKSLTTLLSRLQTHVAISSNTDHSTTHISPFILQKFKANFEYARALLLRLEHESVHIKVTSTKHTVQSQLKQKRTIIRQIQSWIQGVEVILQKQKEDGETELEALEEADNQKFQDAQDNQTKLEQYTPSEFQVSSEIKSEQESVISDLRSRRKVNDSALFSSTKKNESYATGNNFSTKKSNDNDASRDAMLTKDRAEQGLITDQLLTLTRQLKMAQRNFADNIIFEKDSLEGAVSGLDKNISGLDKAGQRMGSLRKLTEGKGWFARLKLYGVLAGLWLLALIIMFVLPKLRFSRGW